MGDRWAGRLAMGVFLLCAAVLIWLYGLETVPGQEPVYLPHRMPAARAKAGAARGVVDIRDVNTDMAYLIVQK